jgi:hypothetical protein
MGLRPLRQASPRGGNHRRKRPHKLHANVSAWENHFGRVAEFGGERATARGLYSSTQEVTLGEMAGVGQHKNARFPTRKKAGIFGVSSVVSDAETLHLRLAKSNVFPEYLDATQLDACVSRLDYSPCLASADALAYLRTVARKFLLVAGGVTFPDKIAFTGMTLP